MRKPKPLLLAAAIAAGLLLAVGLFLSRDDWNWARRPIGWLASRSAGRTIAIEGDLRVDLGRRTNVEAHQILIGNPEWAAIPELASSGRVAFRIRTFPLLFGRLELERLEADDTRLLLERREDGSGNWVFERRAKSGQPLAIPAVVRLRGFDLALADPKRPNGFRLHVDELDSRTLGAVHLFDGRGSYQGEAFALRAALLGLPKKGEGPTPAALDLRVGETVASARGALGDGESPDLVRAHLVARGPTLDDFWRLAGLPFPQSPPFHIDGGFAYRDGEVRIGPFRGTLGRSDLAGDLAVHLPRGGRMRIDADLRSRAVDLDDVEGFWGRMPVEEGEAKVAKAEPAGAVQSVFPDIPFSFPKLRAADARVRYRAARIQGKSLLDHVLVDATLDDGVLDLKPLALGFSAGELAANARIDSRGPVTGLAAEVKLSRIELAELLRRMGVEERGRGELGGRADIQARGNSLHELAQSSNGDVGVVLQNGSLSDPLLELLALHLGDYIVAKLEDDDEVPIRCLVGVFHGEKGKLDAQRLLLDTKHVRIEGEGSIDLARERLDLVLKQHSKDFSIGALRTPIEIEGPFTTRRARLQAGPLAVRGGAAVALGAALHPLAALLALIDPGKDDKPGACAQALAAGAPIAQGVGEKRASIPPRKRAAKERGEGSR